MVMEMEDKNMNKNPKCGHKKILEERAALLSVAGSDSKQRKLHFSILLTTYLVISSFKKINKKMYLKCI